MVAHVGHWYAEALYVLPVVLVVGWLAFTGRREKRRDAKAGTPVRTTPDRSS